MRAAGGVRATMRCRGLRAAKVRNATRASVVSREFLVRHPRFRGNDELW